MRTTLHLPTRPFTVEDVARMVDAGVLGENEPIELLNGELIIVSPQGPQHAYTTTHVLELLSNAYRPAFVVREAKPMVAGSSDLPEPDIAVFRGEPKDFATRHPRSNEAVLVVEVARTSLAVDRSKAAIYARSGVPLYWLLDLTARRLEIHSDPHADGRYGVVRVLAEADTTDAPECSARWTVAELFG
jgi:Uma2 family endonuclease